MLCNFCNFEDATEGRYCDECAEVLSVSVLEMSSAWTDRSRYAVERGKTYANYEVTLPNGQHGGTIEEVPLDLPKRWEICGWCNGEGSSSAHLGEVSQMMDEDPEWAEDYMAGRYDIQCEECRGDGKVRAIDWEMVDDKTAKLLGEDADEAVAAEAMYRAEMGYGY